MEFYQERLKTWRGLRRPPSVLGHAGRESCPIIFGHVQGHEQSLLVSTDEGNENSKANLEEVKHVVRIARQLTLDRTVDPKDIAILTPYNAQAAEISKGLVQRGVTGVTVCSITKSQGEAGGRLGEGFLGLWWGGWPHRALVLGSEWRYVLVSTVRSCPESDLDQRPTKSWLKRFLGFVVDPNQVNVALTRAQEGLCLVGEGCWGRWLGVAAPGWAAPFTLGPPDSPSCRRPPPAAMLPPVAPPPGLLRGPAEPGACRAGAGPEEAGRVSLKGPAQPRTALRRPGQVPAQRIPMCLRWPLLATHAHLPGFRRLAEATPTHRLLESGFVPVGSRDLGGRRVDAHPPG